MLIGGDSTSLCTDPTPLRKSRRRGTLLKFFLRGRGAVCTRARTGLTPEWGRYWHINQGCLKNSIINNKILLTPDSEHQNIKKQQQKQNKYDDHNITVKEQHHFKNTVMGIQQLNIRFLDTRVLKHWNYWKWNKSKCGSCCYYVLWVMISRLWYCQYLQIHYKTTQRINC